MTTFNLNLTLFFLYIAGIATCIDKKVEDANSDNVI